MAVVKLPSGKVRFSVSMLKGCCGVGLLAYVGFYIKPDKQYIRWNSLDGDGMCAPHKKQFKSLYEEFQGYIIGPPLAHDGRYTFDLSRSCLMMTDYVGGQIYEFCRHNKWKMAKPFHNENSGNDVAVFTLVRSNRGN